jgi:putative tryptophan/tyrosine transport system substrate-binding protein
VTGKAIQALSARTAIWLGWLVAILWMIGPALPASLHAREIAVLKSADIAAYNQAVAGLKSELPESTTVSEYNMDGDAERGRKLARDIRASEASVVVAVGLKAALAAKLEIVDVPVIYCMVLDPVKHELQAPNLTGISLQIPVERQFATMSSVLPNLKRVGVLYDPEKTGPFIAEARRVAKGLGLNLVERQVSSEKDFPAALRGMISDTDALWLVPDSTILTEESLRFVLATALDHNVPVVGFSAEFVRNGALIGLSLNAEDIGRQTAGIAKKILKGQSAISLVPAPPSRIRFALNLKTAKYLGISISPEVVNRADELY